MNIDLLDLKIETESLKGKNDILRRESFEKNRIEANQREKIEEQKLIIKSLREDIISISEKFRQVT